MTLGLRESRFLLFSSSGRFLPASRHAAPLLPPPWKSLVLSRRVALPLRQSRPLWKMVRDNEVCIALVMLLVPG
jgi:hypothetical protein